MVLFSGTMDYDYPPDAPDYDDLEDLLDELEGDKQLVIDDTGIVILIVSYYMSSPNLYVLPVVSYLLPFVTCCRVA